MDKKAFSIYFCGSIKGGRSDQQLYADLISYLQNFGVVLTAHVGEKDLLTDHNLSSRDIYNRDMNWLDEADIIVAEVSTPSLGVGYEIARAVDMGKKILCLSQLEKNQTLSALISGCPDLQIVIYSNIEEAKTAIDQFISLKQLHTKTI